MEQTFALGEYGKHLWTRDLARKIRVRVVEGLAELAPGDVLVIDAQGVEVFDFSFANELFGKLLLELPKDHSGRFVIVEHLTAYTRENLAKALESLGLVIIERKGKKLEMLGKAHTVDQQTFNVIAQAKESITAAELKEKLGINLNAMNERLTKLTGLGLVRREKTVSGAGREQYEYRVLS
ncbi:MAG: DUF4325 domain-containing protein [Bryobacteraceae bacterium]|jgi:hypothetical protein